MREQSNCTCSGSFFLLQSKPWGRWVKKGDKSAWFTPSTRVFPPTSWPSHQFHCPGGKRNGPSTASPGVENNGIVWAAFWQLPFHSQGLPSREKLTIQGSEEKWNRIFTALFRGLWAPRASDLPSAGENNWDSQEMATIERSPLPFTQLYMHSFEYMCIVLCIHSLNKSYCDQRRGYKVEQTNRPWASWSFLGRMVAKGKGKDEKDSFPIISLLWAVCPVRGSINSLWICTLVH